MNHLAHDMSATPAHENLQQDKIQRMRMPPGIQVCRKMVH